MLRRLRLVLASTALACCAFAGGTTAPVTFTKLVTTAGTPVALTSTPTRAISLTIQVPPITPGFICIGDKTINAATWNGVCGTAMSGYALFNVSGVVYDLSTIYIDSQYSGYGVTVTYWPLPTEAGARSSFRMTSGDAFAIRTVVVVQYQRLIGGRRGSGSGRIR